MEAEDDMTGEARGCEARKESGAKERRHFPEGATAKKWGFPSAPRRGQPGQCLAFSPVIPISDSGHRHWTIRHLCLFSVTKCVKICYSSRRKLIHHGSQ